MTDLQSKVAICVTYGHWCHAPSGISST